MRGHVVALLLAVLLLLPRGATAHHIDLLDPDDTAGRMDIRSVETWPGARPLWKVVTFARWRATEIWDRGFLLIYFDTLGDARFDYYVLLRSTGQRMQALLFRDRAVKSDYVIATLNPWRVGPTSVSVRIPLAVMNFGAQRLFYGWAVRTLMSNNRNCRRVCLDSAPDQGAVIEPLTQSVTAALP